MIFLEYLACFQEISSVIVRVKKVEVKAVISEAEVKIQINTVVLFLESILQRTNKHQKV